MAKGRADEFELPSWRLAYCSYQMIVFGILVTELYMLEQPLLRGKAPRLEA